MNDQSPTARSDSGLLALARALPAEAQLGEGPIGPEVQVPPDGLVAAAMAIRQSLAAPLMTMVGTDERRTRGGYLLRYIFGDDHRGRCITLTTGLLPDELSFPSLTPFLPAAHWYEREVQDLLGLRAEGHPDPRRLVLHERFPEDYYPLRKDAGRPILLDGAQSRQSYAFHRVEGEGLMEIPVGPIHAGIIEPAHFRFSTVGEVILLLEARLFYTHRGLERQAEGRSLSGGLLVAERACGVCAVAHSIAYAEAAEQVAGCIVPPRATALRLVLLELERLYNHIGDIGNICAGTSLMVGAAHGGRLKEILQRLNERLTGNRYLRGLLAVGGLRRDLDELALTDIRRTLIDLQRDFAEYASLLSTHDTFQERLTGTGRLDRAVATALGAVGVAARASGIARDSRLLYRRAMYGGHQPEISVYEEGDVRARVRVRLDEIASSFHLVRELLRTLPDGPIAAPYDPAPAGRIGLGIAESPRGDTIHWLQTDQAGRLDRLRIRSASYCNWPVVGFAGPGNMVPDFPLINKSFELCYSCCDR